LNRQQHFGGGGNGRNFENLFTSRRRRYFKATPTQW